MEPHLPESDIQARARRRLRERRDFRLHLLFYVSVNLLLVAIWAATGGPFWPIFPILGWGLGVMLNGWSTFWRREITADRIAREVERLRDEERC